MGLITVNSGQRYAGYATRKQTISPVIANGAAVSDNILLSGFTPVALILPLAWDAAAISFDVSYDGGQTFFALFGAPDAAEISIPAALVTSALGAAIALPLPENFAGADGIRLRSGVVGAAVNQTAARTLTVVLYAF